MTVTTLNSSTSVIANGSQTTFQFDFALLDTDHLYVYTITTSGVKTLETDYTVPSYGDEGGSITFSVDATPADGETVLMDRNVPVTQETDYLPNDPFPAEVHEDALDKLTMIVQDSNYVFDRAITVPLGDTATDLELPFATDRADKYISFDSNGDVIMTSTAYDGDIYTADEIDSILENYLQVGDVPDYYNVVGDWNKQQYFGIATITGAWNLDDAQVAQITLGASNTISNPTNQKAGGSYMLKVIQDGTGSRTITWGANYKFEDDTDPEISSGAGEVSIIVFISDGTYMYGTLQWKETT